MSVCDSCHLNHGLPGPCPPRQTLVEQMKAHTAARRAIHNIDKENQMSPIEHALKQVQQQKAAVAYTGLDVCMDKIPAPTVDLLNERQTTHGSFEQNSRIGQALRDFFRAEPGWQRATWREREALDYIAGKLSRILSGKPDAQHWEDIAGYATLAANPDLQR